MKGLFPDPLKIMKQIKNDRKCFQAEGKGTPVGKCNSSEEEMAGWIQNKWGAELSPRAWSSNHMKYWCLQKGRQVLASACVLWKTRSCMSSGVTPQVRSSRCKAMREWIGKEGWRRKAWHCQKGVPASTCPTNTTWPTLHHTEKEAKIMECKSRAENGIFFFQANKSWKYNKTFSHWSLPQGSVSKNNWDCFSLDYWWLWNCPGWIHLGIFNKGSHWLIVGVQPAGNGCFEYWSPEQINS